MSGEAWAGLILEGPFELSKVRGAVARRWKGAELGTVALNGATWVSPMWRERSRGDTFDASVGSAEAARDVARACGVATWWYEYFSRSAFFANAVRYDAAGSVTLELSADEDPAAFDALASQVGAAVGWPPEVFSDFDRLLELSGGPFHPDPATVPDEAKIQVRLELPVSLLEQIQAEAVEQDSSLSSIVARLVAMPRAASPAPVAGARVGQRFYLPGSRWKALCADARAHAETPSQALLARVALRSGR